MARPLILILRLVNLSKILLIIKIVAEDDQLLIGSNESNNSSQNLSNSKKFKKNQKTCLNLESQKLSIIV